MKATRLSTQSSGQRTKANTIISMEMGMAAPA
jgi:hypothetical protein